MQKTKINDPKDLTAAKTAKSPSKPPPKTKATKAKEPETMSDLLSQTGYTLNNLQKGKVVEAKVTYVSDRLINFDIGGKAEAQVHEKELPYIQDLMVNMKPGDKVTVTIVNPENDRGQTIVSLRKTALIKRWEILAEKMKKNETVEVVIKDLSKGGFLVDFAGLRGFIPLSQTDSEFTRLGERAAGRHISVKPIEVDKEVNRLVFSQIAGGISPKQQAALKLVEVGKTYKADVTGVAPFGGFVNVKITPEVTLLGLIHISEIAWEKVENIGDYLKAGQNLDVKVIGVDKKIGKLTLSVKQLLPDPWEDVVKVFSVDQVVKGKVTRITQFGAFVSLLPGIDGLIHISKIAPGEEPKAGEDIECTIEEINPDKRKISLSIVTHAKPIGYR